MAPLTNVVPHLEFQEYKELFKEHFLLERDERGVVVAQAHTNGGEAIWSLELHRAYGQLFHAIGVDPKNEVLILTGTDDVWMMDMDRDSFGAIEQSTEQYQRETFHWYYRDGTKMQEALLWDIEIPTISIINGPGQHTEVALLCDLTLCATDAYLFEAHYKVGLAPGDALFLVLQQLLGPKRANYALYTGQNISAEQALEWGLVNEVLPRDQLLPRAREIADMILEQDGLIRRLTTQIVKRPWHKAFVEDFRMQFGHQMWGAMVHPPSPGEMDIRGVSSQG